MGTGCWFVSAGRKVQRSQPDAYLLLPASQRAAYLGRGNGHSVLILDRESGEMFVFSCSSSFITFLLLQPVATCHQRKLVILTLSLLSLWGGNDISIALVHNNNASVHSSALFLPSKKQSWEVGKEPTFSIRRTLHEEAILVNTLVG